MESRNGSVLDGLWQHTISHLNTDWRFQNEEIGSYPKLSIRNISNVRVPKVSPECLAIWSWTEGWNWQNILEVKNIETRMDES